MDKLSLDSAFAQLLLLCRQALHEEISLAVRQALAQHHAGGRAGGEPTVVPEASALLSVREAAAFLQVSVATVHAWKRQGLIAYRKIGARTLFERTALLAAAAPQPAFDGRRTSPRRRK
ncbi:helix-turn-helix domain-containing protein [Hymenobacter antarcticus]|uniref:Helix-turn-helix domain-containing protein n=1 Tax=Hymenobacter antarcticus TaxID=486270 RepID=A0ABP7PQR0_9BACT